MRCTAAGWGHVPWDCLPAGRLGGWLVVLQHHRPSVGHSPLHQQDSLCKRGSRCRLATTSADTAAASLLCLGVAAAAARCCYGLELTPTPAAGPSLCVC